MNPGAGTRSSTLGLFKQSPTWTGPGAGPLIPDPAALHAASAGQTKLVCLGSDFEPDLPYARTAIEPPTALFAPDWSSNSAGFQGLAFAIYKFCLTGYSGPEEIHLSFTATGEQQDCYIGISDYSHGCWRWYALPAVSEAVVVPVTLTGCPRTDDDCLLVAPVFIGTSAWTLSRISLGPETAPVINSVSPLAGTTGADIVFSADIDGTAPFDYAWDFGGGAVPNTSDSPEPAVTLGAVGEYPASLKVSNAYGEDTFLFSLTVLADLPSWQHTWGGAESEGASAVCADSSGNVYAAGSTIVDGTTATLLVKYQSSGQLEWTRIWNGADSDSSIEVLIDANGNIYLIGGTRSFGAGNADVLVLKYSPAGQLLWQRTWGGAKDDSACDAAIDALGNIYITGYSCSFKEEEYEWNHDLLLLKSTAAGAEEWAVTWGGDEGKDSGLGIAVDDGGVVITGRTSSYGQYDYMWGYTPDLAVLRFTHNGALSWESSWATDYDTDPNNSDRYAEYGMAVDTDGTSIFVTGYRQHAGYSNTEMIILKYNMSGSIVAEKMYSGHQCTNPYEIAIGLTGAPSVMGIVLDGLPGTPTEAVRFFYFDDSCGLDSTETWEGDDASIRAFHLSDTGAFYYAGAARSNTGGIQPASASSFSFTSHQQDLEGNLMSVDGAVDIPDGTEGELSPGVADTGGGRDDLLVIKITPAP